MIQVLHFETDHDFHGILAWNLKHVDPEIELELVPGFQDVLLKARNQKCDCILTNEYVHDGKGIELVNSLRRDELVTPVVVLTDEALDKDLEFEVGFFSDDLQNARVNFETFGAIARAIRAVSGRAKTNSEEVEELLVPLQTLTQREKQVLESLYSGLSNKEIAAELGISYFTVVNHIQNLYRKLEIHSRVEAIHLVVRLKKHGVDLSV